MAIYQSCIPRPTVEAFQYDGTNGDWLAKWTDGLVVYNAPDDIFMHVPVFKYREIEIGDYVVWSSDEYNFAVWRAEEFEPYFEKISEGTLYDTLSNN